MSQRASCIRLWLVSACLGSIALAQSAGTFTPTGAMITPRFLHTATLLQDGRVLIAGGQSNYGQAQIEASAELYDPATGSFTPTGPMTIARQQHTATLLPDGRVLIAGGGSGSADHPFALNSAEVYDPATGAFSQTGSMTWAHEGQTAMLLANGEVLIGPTFGELYDPLAGTFSPTGVMDFPVQTATLLSDGRVLTTWVDADSCDAESVASLYDQAAGAFLPTGDMAYLQAIPTATSLLNGKVLIAGGDGDPFPRGTTTFWPWDGLDVAELYDPIAGVFIKTGRMTRDRDAHTATLLPDGTVLLAGGHIGEYGTPGYTADNVSSAEIYDPVTGGFSATGSMNTGRQWAVATLLADGQVLMTGGLQYDQYDSGGRGLNFAEPAVAELYTPAALLPPAVLLSTPNGAAAIQHADYSLVTPENPAVAGEIVLIYCTGLAEGGLLPPQVSIGGRTAEVLWFGDTPGYVGLNQINARVPNTVSGSGTASVRLSYLSRPGNAVSMSIH